MSKQKRNCKHGLTNLEEIEARKIRKDFLEKGKESQYFQRMLDLYNAFRKNPNQRGLSLKDYVKQVDIVMWSACERLNLNYLEFIMFGTV